MTAQQIIDIIEADEDSSIYFFGLRRLHADEPDQPGAQLAQSWVWDDGEITDEALDGTCAMYIRRRNLQSVSAALDAITQYRFVADGDGARIALIKGSSHCFHDTLEAEATIIIDAEVVIAWTE